MLCSPKNLEDGLLSHLHNFSRIQAITFLVSVHIAKLAPRRNLFTACPEIDGMIRPLNFGLLTHGSVRLAYDWCSLLLDPIQSLHIDTRFVGYGEVGMSN